LRRARSSLASRKQRSRALEAPSLALVAFMLFVSGSSALVFQVAWMRDLRLVFGATTAAVAAVLAIFMGGLGLGSTVLGKRVDRAANPLRVYGLLEMSVAVAVAVSPLLVIFVSRIYFGLGGQESLGVNGATFVRLLLAVVVMGIPTFLMGGTLPAAVRSVTAEGDTRRRALAVLYGVNTLGAVCGAYFATFYALEMWGTRSTLWAGCAMNFLVGLIAVAAAKSAPELAESRDSPSIAAEAEGPGGSLSLAPSYPQVGANHTKLLYATAAVLGFTFFSLELVWYRMLAPILGGTTFTFGLILCVALFGIGVGGAAYNMVFRWVRPTWSALAMTCAAEAAFAAIPLGLGDRVAVLAGRLSIYSDTLMQVIGGWLIVMAIVVLPVALVSGLQFPLLIALLGQGRAAVSRQLGMAYAWNTVGAIAGSLVGGFGLMPLLTAPGAWRAVVVVLAALAIVLVAGTWQTARRSALCVAGLLLVAVACLMQQGPTAVWRHSGIGAGRAVVPPSGAKNPTLLWMHEQRRNLQWEADGIESSIGITAPDGLSFVVNGKNDGNAIGDAGTQIGVAILGAALHPAPKTGLVIGLGTGESAGWLADMPGMERVDVLELEPAIDEMARRSSDVNRNVLEHPKVRRIYNDGREHVFTTNEKYDVVLSEPSNPYRAGVAALYTLEFYRQLAKTMNPDGVFVQWLQAYEVDQRTVETVLKTARSVFPHVEVWQSIPGDLQVICSMQPIRYTAAELRTRISTPVMQEALRVAWNAEDLEGFLAHFLANPRFVDAIARDTSLPLNTDDRTILEYGFAKTVGLTTGFGASGLRDLAISAGMHRPAIAEEEIDWGLVEARRIDFNVLFDGNVSPETQRTPQLKALAEAIVRVRAEQWKEAVAAWQREPDAPLGDVSRLVRAQTQARLGQEEYESVLAPIAVKYPAEAASIRAMYAWQKKDAAAAAVQLRLLFDALGQSPWAMSMVVRPSLELAMEVGDPDPAISRRLYDQLAQPFAGYRFEHHRKIVRSLLAENLGQATMIEAFEAMEPYVPWIRRTLERRAQVYAEANHPLAERAAREWELYQRNEPVPESDSAE
jgi:spermidine synthase